MENLKTETGAGTGPAPVSFSARTVKVIVRHGAICRDKNRSGDRRKCRCPKALLIYEGHGPSRNRRVSAKARLGE